MWAHTRLQDISGVGHGTQWWDRDKSKSREWRWRVSGWTRALPPACPPPAPDLHLPHPPVSSLEAATGKGGGHAGLWRGQSQTEAKPRAALGSLPCTAILEGLQWVPSAGGPVPALLEHPPLCRALCRVLRALRTDKALVFPESGLRFVVFNSQIRGREAGRSYGQGPRMLLCPRYHRQIK